MTTATPDRETQLLAKYRTLPSVQRRRIAERASPELRPKLAHIERQIAMDRSPGALAAVLTEGREKQAAHLDMIDSAFRRIAAGGRLQVMLTCPPRHGKSQRASRWGPLWYLRRHPEHRVMIASYGADLADDHGRWVRDQLREYPSVLGIRLNPASHAANRFDLEQASISGIPVPKSVLQSLVSHYSKSESNPRGVGLDDPFVLPAAIREIRVEPGRAIVVQ